MFWIPFDLPPQKPTETYLIDNWSPDSLPIDISSVDARFTISTSPNRLRAIVTVQGQITQNGSVKLHAENLDITSVIGNPPVRDYSNVENLLNINHSPPLISGQPFEVTISYTAENSPSIHETGLHHLQDIAFTFNEPYGARKWLPIHDVPFDRFQWSITMNVPPGWIAVSNQSNPVLSSPPTQTNASVVPYLIHFAAAPYNYWQESVQTFQGSTVLLSYYARPNFFNAARYDWQRTPQIMQTLTEVLGDYPFQSDGYGMVEAPILGGSGAMEHLAMSTIGSNLITGDRMYELVVVHELAHQWFGNHITPTSFQDIWLNEGFASFTESLWLEQIQEGNPIQHRKNQAENYFREAQRQQFPITDPPNDNLFSSAVYHKGAWILHQLRIRLGGDEFFRRLRNYYVQNQSSQVSLVTSQRFIHAFSMNGADVQTEHFLQEWLNFEGHPKIKLTFQQIGNGTQIQVKQVQSSPIFHSGFPLTLEHRQNNQSTYNYLTMQNQMEEIWWENTTPENIFFLWNDSALVEVLPTPDVKVRLQEKNLSIRLLTNPTTNSAFLLVSLSYPGIVNGNLKLFNILGKELFTSTVPRLSTGEKKVKISLPQLPSGYYVWSMEIGKLSAATPMLHIR